MFIDSKGLKKLQLNFCYCILSSSEAVTTFVHKQADKRLSSSFMVVLQCLGDYIFEP